MTILPPVHSDGFNGRFFVSKRAFKLQDDVLTVGGAGHLGQGLRRYQRTGNQMAHRRVNFSNALSRLTVGQQQEVEHRVESFHALPIPELDPKLKDWQKNPAYQPEDGRFGH